MRAPRGRQQPAANTEFQGDPADVRKIIALGVLGLAITFVSMAGALHLYNRPTSSMASDDDSDMPSARSLGMALASGGKIDARQFDKAMNDMCQHMGEMSGDSISTSKCKKSMRGGWW